MAYRFDKDLEFLGQLTDEELAPLVDILIKDEKGSSRLTEELTSSTKYKIYAPEHSKYWREIAEEIQLFGGNTLVSNIFRGGKGVFYREILIDVAKKLKVDFDKNDKVENIERALLLKLFEDVTENISREQLDHLIKELHLPTSINSSGTITMALITALKSGGLSSAELSLFISNSLMKFMFGRGFIIGTNMTISRILGVFTGPIGLGLMGGLTILDIASPAFRVTTPAVVCVAALRAQLLMRKQMEQQKKVENKETNFFTFS